MRAVITGTPTIVCGSFRRTGRHSIARSSQHLRRIPGGGGFYYGPQHPAAAVLRSPTVGPFPSVSVSVSWSCITRPLATASVTTTKETTTTTKETTMNTTTKKPVLTPLQQAAQDARDEAERRDLETRIQNAEQNEHIPAPGGEYDVEGAIEIMANRKIRQYMQQQQTTTTTITTHPGDQRDEFGLAHRSGTKLASRCPVGDILGTAGYVPVWVELQHQITTRIHHFRTRTATTPGTGEGSHPTDTTTTNTNSNTAGGAAGGAVTISDEEISELRALQRKYNQQCPPPFQQALVTRATVFSTT